MGNFSYQLYSRQQATGNRQQWEKYFSVLRFIINISQTPTRSLL
ncbi:hypothetical protein [Okeania sp. SIO1F9]|nr:hypothetical protein [Okeania sp. SIO1F9]